MMKKILFSGACTALVTPFFEGQINYSMLEKLIARQIDAGIRAFVLAGTTGEAPTLTEEEKITMISRCKAYVGDTCTIIAGTGLNSTSQTVHLSEKAEKAGADALLVVSPYYNKPNPDGLYVHYWTVAQHTDLPVIIYNVPGRTGLDIPVSVYKELSLISNIAGIKEANPDIRKIAHTAAQCNLPIWSGCDDLTVPVLSMGGKGVISVLSNLFPTEVKDMCDSALAGDFKKAVSIQNSLTAINDLLFCEVNPIPVKYALQVLGFDCGECRLPLSKLSMENKEKIKKHLLLNMICAQNPDQIKN